MKKLHVLPFLAALILTLCCILPTKAEAATSGYYTYTVSGGKATITDCSTSISGNITIPSTLGGYPVTSIGNSAFRGCSSLTSITIPDSVTSIGEGAFSGCSSLESMTIPFVGGSKKTASDTYQYPFGYIFGTSSYTSGVATKQYYYGSSTSSTTSSTYYIPSSLKSVTVTSGEICYGAFYNCSSLTSITIPDSVTSIGNYAFYNCSGLGGITIPDSVTSIGVRAFSGCSSLTSITIPDSVTSIGGSAFYNCRSLTSITIPDSVTSIGAYAFSGCSSLTYHTYDNAKYLGNEQNPHMALVSSTSESITSCEIYAKTKIIASSAFYNCSSLTRVTIPDSITSIGSSAFRGCSRLTSITIPDSVTSIGGYAFEECSSLTSITIPNSVTSIGDSAFDGCSSLTSITIPDSVTSIGERAFWYCSSLTSITIPDSVTSIGNYAFYGCSSLTSITIGNSVTSIGDYAFYNCNKLSHVAYTGSQSQWNRITFGSGNSKLTEATRHYEAAFQTLDNCMETSTYCPVCQITLTRTEKPDGSHAFAPGTCTTPKTCTICFVTEGEALGHSGQWMELVPATCTTDGINARICTTCGETETETVVATGHSYSAVVVEPTCTEQGYTTKTCATCGDVTTEYVPAKGHGWSAWITTVKPTCTTEGAQMRFCNCGTRETEVIAKLSHSFENEVCTRCGESEYFRMSLTEDTTVTLELERDVYIQLNGFDLTGTITTNGFKVYGMDETTAGYTCENIGYFTCVDEKGDPVVPERYYQVDSENWYLTVGSDEGYSFHAVRLAVTHMTLRPDVVGVGYKAVLCGDEMVLSQLDDARAFRFCLQLDGYDPVHRHLERGELVSGNEISFRLINYDIENYGETDLFASLAITLQDGTVLGTPKATMTMRSLFEYVNDNTAQYTQTQLADIKTMIETYAIIKKWDVSNLI